MHELWTGAEYRNERKVGIAGEGAVEDVTTHPTLRAMVDEYVAWYDRHFDPAHRPQRTLSDVLGGCCGIAILKARPRMSEVLRIVPGFSLVAAPMVPHRVVHAPDL